MLRKTGKQFSAQTLLYDRIPEDHVPKLIEKTVDFSFINEKPAGSYCADFGRPAKEPEMMMKLNMSEYLYNLSDERVIEEVSCLRATTHLQNSFSAISSKVESRGWRHSPSGPPSPAMPYLFDRWHLHRISENPCHFFLYMSIISFPATPYARINAVLNLSKPWGIPR